jgi:hypothetical protein
MDSGNNYPVMDDGTSYPVIKLMSGNTLGINLSNDQNI